MIPPPKLGPAPSRVDRPWMLWPITPPPSRIPDADRQARPRHTRLGGKARNMRAVPTRVSVYAWSVAHGLEVVGNPVGGHVTPERLALYVRGAEVEAGPDARVDELGERLREGVEAPHLLFS